MRTIGSTQYWMSIRGNALTQVKIGIIISERNGCSPGFRTSPHVVQPGSCTWGGEWSLISDGLAEHMLPAQIAEAQKLAQEWKPKGK